MFYSWTRNGKKWSRNWARKCKKLGLIIQNLPITKGWLGRSESTKKEAEGGEPEAEARGEEVVEGERRRPEKWGPEAFSIT